MWISATLVEGNTRWLGEPCKRENMLCKANIGKTMWEDNCVTVNHISVYGSDPKGTDAELYALFVEQEVGPPPTILQIKFTRNGTHGNFLNVTLSINPELMGFARETETAWGRNPWNKTMSLKDPAMKQFIDALSVWALQFAKQMDAALEKKTGCVRIYTVLEVGAERFAETCDSQVFGVVGLSLYAGPLETPRKERCSSNDTALRTGSGKDFCNPKNSSSDCRYFAARYR